MDAAKLNPKIDVPDDALKILAEISQEINASLNLDEVLASAAKLIKRLIDYEIFAVLLPEEGTDQMYFRFAIGHRKEVVEHWRIPMGDGIIGAAAATGQAIRVGDVRTDPRYLNCARSRPLGTGRAADRSRPRDRRHGHRKPPAGLFHSRRSRHSYARRQPHRHGR